MLTPSVVSRFSSVSVMVVGDWVCDIFMQTRPERLSREAPVVVVQYEKEEWIPGCAGNTAHNLVSLGARIFPVGVVGDDAHGAFLRRFFEQRSVSTGGLFVHPEKQTPFKLRVMAGDAHTRKQQVIRIDRSRPETLPPALERNILRFLEEQAPHMDALIVSDYGYELLSPKIRSCLQALTSHVRLIVDSHERLQEFKGVYAMTPNEGEAQRLCRQEDIQSDEAARRAGEKLLQELDIHTLLLTRGNKGMMVFDRELGFEPIPVVGQSEPVDVTGAGDTVVSVFALGLALGLSSFEAAALANVAAGIVVMKTGTAVPTPEELVQAMGNRTL